MKREQIIGRLNDAIDDEIVKYGKDTNALASQILNSISDIGKEISFQIVVFNAADRTNNHSIAEILDACVDKVNFNQLVESPFFLGYKENCCADAHHYIHLNRHCLDRDRLIEELYRLTPFGLDMCGIKPEYMKEEKVG